MAKTKKKITKTSRTRGSALARRAASHPSSSSRKTPKRAGTDPARVRAILQKLDEAYPAATCALKHENPFQLLISTILSAQCTDERVNQVTATLFPKYPDPKAFAYANPSELESEIRPTGFFRNKTKSIMGANGRWPIRLRDADFSCPCLSCSWGQCNRPSMLLRSPRA